jgi:transposase
MSNGRIEILGARERRRRWSVEAKLRIVAESEEPGAVVRAVAARHDVYPGLLHAWRRQVRRGRLVSEQAVRMLPVRVTETSALAADVPATPTTHGVERMIEICLPDGSRVRVGDDVSLKTLRRVMTVLRG